MTHITRPTALLALLLGLAALLGVATAAEPEATCPPGQQPHHKSDGANVVCIPGPDAPISLADANAPVYGGLQPYQTTDTGSWPYVLGALQPPTATQPVTLAIGTGQYADAANDTRLLRYRWDGSSLERTATIPGGRVPEALTVADLERLDQQNVVAVAFPGEDRLAVYTATATMPLSVTLPGYLNALAAPDVTGDLWPDLAAIAYQDEHIHLLEVGQDGLAQLPLHLPHPTNAYNALRADDLDNDGDEDLAALRGSGTFTEPLVIYYQDATYGQPGTFPTSLALRPDVGYYVAHSVALGDVSDDGLADIVVSAGGNDNDSYLNVFIQQNDGTFDPTPTTIYDANDVPTAVAIADINHDGLNDVLLLNDGHLTLSVYLQNASGTLDPFEVAEVPYSSRYRPDALSVADLNADGSLDVALVNKARGLVTLFNEIASAPTSRIVTPPEASTVAPGPLLVTGTASADAVAVEVRLRGATDWLPATLNDTDWEIELELPEEYRPWWIESRAIDAAGRYQAPVDRQRIATVLLECVPQTLTITGIGMDGAETGSLLVPADAISTTLQLGGSAYRDPAPETATVDLADGSTVELNKPTRLIDQEPDVSPFKIGYTFETAAPPGLAEVAVNDPHRTTQALVAYSAVPTDTLYSWAYTTTLQYAWGGNDGHNAVGPATLPLTLTAPLPGVRDVQVQAVVIDKEPRQGSDQRIAIVRADAGNGIVAEQIITTPDEPHLNVVDLTLEAVPAGTQVFTISLISPFNPAGQSQWNNPNAGDSVFLIGGAVQHACAATAATARTGTDTRYQGFSLPEARQSAPSVAIVTPEEGGTLEIGRFRMTVPPGAVETDTRLLYSASPDLPRRLGSAIPTLRSFTLGAVSSAGEPVTTFMQPAEITLRYDASEPGDLGIEQEQMMLAYWDAESTSWQTMPRTVDTETGEVTASLDQVTEVVLIARERLEDPRPESTTTTLYLPLVTR
jgi:hypothetical protein